jgi:hypothetical protein
VTGASGDARRGPIFIGGADRTGKTLLAALLGSHSRIAISAVGSNLWTLFYGRFGDLQDPGHAEACIRSVLSYKHVAYLKPDGERLRRDFASGPRSYARLFALIQEQHAEQLGKPRWGDQTGLVERFADPIFAAYPDAVMVHVVRDPRDRYEAAARMWPDGRLGVGGATARWLLSTSLAATNLRRHGGDRYLVIRYEDLARSPEPTIRAVCDHVGETFEPAMMEMGAMPTYRAKLLEGRSESPGVPLITDGHVGRFRGRLASADLRFIQERAGRAMRRHGYDPVEVPMSTGQQVHYHLVTRPSHLIRQWAWQLRTALATRAPRWFGTGPRKGMRL